MSVIEMKFFYPFYPSYKCLGQKYLDGGELMKVVKWVHLIKKSTFLYSNYSNIASENKESNRVCTKDALIIENHDFFSKEYN